MQVVFARPLFLLLFLILPVFYYIYYRSSIYTGKKRSPLIVALRLGLVICLLLALAGPQILLPVKKQTVIFVADLSESMRDVQQEVQSFIEEALNNKGSKDKAGIITFAKEAVMEKPLHVDYPFTDFETGPPSDFTNIEAALRTAEKHISDNELTTVVLLSDGEENLGQTGNIIPAYRKKGIAVDVKILSAELEEEIQVNKLLLPEKVRPGQNFQIKVNVESNSVTGAALRLYHNDNLIKRDELTLTPGENLYSHGQVLSESGFHSYRVEIEGEVDTIRNNNSASGFVVVTGQKRLLIIGDQDRGVERLMSSLNENRIAVDIISAGSFPQNRGQLHSYSAVLLNNLPASALARREMEMLKTYVEDSGGGLIAVGGDTSLTAGDYADTVLEDILPVSSELEQEAYTPTLSLLLIIDVSGSMGDGQQGGSSSKIEIGKRAARASAEILLEREKIGIITFDTEVNVVLPVQRAENMSEIIAKIETIKSGGGGTSIYPALEQAYEILNKEETATRHAILISDGITKSNAFEQIAKGMAEEGITLSTIGIGGDADLELMARLANWGAGKSYYTTDISAIPRILSTETERIIPSALIEEEIKITPVGRNVFTTSINWEQAPQLYGFVKTTPEVVADVYLRAPDKSPIVAGWRYGLGRTLVFTSDLGDSWAQEWLDWEGYHEFWQEAINWVLPVDNNDLSTAVSLDGDKGNIVVNAVGENGEFLNFLDLEARIETPEGQVIREQLSQIGSGKYKAEFSVNRPGNYMINIIHKEEAEGTAVTTGLTVPYSPEYKFSFSDDGSLLLREITNYTGGRILQSPQAVYENPPLTYSDPVDISNYLIILALIIFLIDVAVRTISWQSIKSIFTHHYS